MLHRLHRCKTRSNRIKSILASLNQTKEERKHPSPLPFSGSMLNPKDFNSGKIVLPFSQTILVMETAKWLSSSYKQE